MICLGAKIRVAGGNLYLGRWIHVGETGKVIGRKRTVSGQRGYLVRMDKDNDIYTLTSGEMEVVQP